MYKPRAVELHKSAHAQFVALHLETSKTKLAANDCDEARREAELVLGVEAKNKRAAAVLKRCEALAKQPAPEASAAAPKPVSEPVAVAPKPAPRRPAAAVVAARVPAHKPKPADEPPRAEPMPVADPDKLIKDAQQAWFRVNTHWPSTRLAKPFVPSRT